MTDEKDPITDFDLVAYADGKLDPKRAERVRRHLDDRPDLAALVEDYAAQNRAMKAAYDPVIQEDIPARLKGVERPRPTRPTAVRLAKAAAVVGLVAATGVTGWIIGRSSEADSFGAGPFARVAAAKHVDLPKIQAASQPDKFSPLRWLSKRISLELEAPDLADHGYTLVARRKVELNGEPAVQLVYDSGGDSRLSIFLRRRWRDDGPRIHTTEIGDRSIVYWLDGPIAYGLTGEAPRDSLTTIARDVDRKMNIEPKVVPSSIEARDDQGVMRQGGGDIE